MEIRFKETLKEKIEYLLCPHSWKLAQGEVGDGSIVNYRTSFIDPVHIMPGKIDLIAVNERHK